MKLEEIERLKASVFLAVFFTLMSSIYYFFNIIYERGVFYPKGELTVFDMFFIFAVFSVFACAILFSIHKNKLSEFADLWIQENESKVKEKMIFHLRLLVTYFAVLSLITNLKYKYYPSGMMFTSVSLLGFVVFLARQKKLKEEISFSRVSALKSIVMIQIPISKYQEAGIYDEETDIFELDISGNKNLQQNSACELLTPPSSGRNPRL